MIMDFEPVEVDAVLYIDTDPAVCLERNRKRAVKAERALTLDYLNDLDRYYCQQVVNRLRDGSSAVLVVHDPGTFLDNTWLLEQMARFITVRSDGNIPGRAFLEANWSQYEDIIHENETRRRELMVALSQTQLEEMSTIGSGISSGLSTPPRSTSHE